MNQKTIITLAVGAGAAFLLARVAVQKGLATGVLRSGDAERTSGINHLYSTNSSQQAAVNSAVQANWADLQNSVFKTEPDFWV